LSRFALVGPPTTQPVARRRSASLTGDDAGELQEEPRGFAGVGRGAVGGAGRLAVLGLALGAGGVVVADDGGDGLDGVADVEGGDVASVCVCRRLAEREDFTRLRQIEPREHAAESVRPCFCATVARENCGTARSSRISSVRVGAGRREEREVDERHESEGEEREGAEGLGGKGAEGEGREGAEGLRGKGAEGGEALTRSGSMARGAGEEGALVGKQPVAYAVGVVAV
jgi:hypothetical protein